MTARATPAGSPEAEPAFERALADEILQSEQLRIRVLAATLGFLLVVDQLMFIFAADLLNHFTTRPLPMWLPVAVVGPFLAYETIVLLVLRWRRARGLGMPTLARFANAVIETSFPTVILWAVYNHTSATVAFGAWAPMVYFIFIVASTLRLDLVLPVFTGVVAAASYLGLAYGLLPLDRDSTEPVLTPFFHGTKAAIMVLTGVVAGLVAMRLRAKFRHAVEQEQARERVTNLFGQHVSPAVVDRLLDRPTELVGEQREICVLFLDIRNFTANARERSPEAVVDFLNAAFAFMIEAVDRHGGFINKFLGDGFMAIFGAPLDDPAAARNAVAAARDILDEIDRRGLTDGPWPLRVGIGLHLGRAVTGNVGSPRRKEFTAIGDTVNLAARLEQLTKEHGARLIVSDAVVSAIGGASATAAPLGAVNVKGYAEPVHAWRLA